MLGRYLPIMNTSVMPRRARCQSTAPPNEGAKMTTSHTSQTTPVAENPSVKASPMHKPNKIDKWLLVWDKKYKTYQDVPTYVSFDKMERARNWARIKISTYLMIGTVLGCIAMVYSGKRAAARGESVTKLNLEMHRRNREEAMKEKLQSSSP